MVYFNVFRVGLHVLFIVGPRCQGTYIGQTTQWLKQRITQHRSDCRLGKNSCAVVEHQNRTGHIFDFTNVKVLDHHNNNKRTKRCGTGDVAKDYHDLGEDILTDICCRTHDLCPVKIRAFMKKYDLSNDSIYTKSHCNCDDMFHSCMKRLGTKSAQILGQIYFNLVKVPCLQDGKEGRYFRKSKEF